MGGSKRIERVYFEIKESNIEQWEKPQIKVPYFVLAFYLTILFAILIRVIYASKIVIWLEGPKVSQIYCNPISIFRKNFVLHTYC